MLSLKFYLNKELLIELCLNITESQIATVAMKTVQLVLSEFNNF